MTGRPAPTADAPLSRTQRLVVFVVALVALVALALYFALVGSKYGLDLRVYRAGIHAWESGRDPYKGSYTIHRLAFTYPPSALPLLSPLDWAPFGWTEGLVWLLSVGSLAGSALLVLRKRGLCQQNWAVWAVASFAWVAVAGLLVEPMRSMLDYAQVNGLLVSMVVVDLLVVNKRHRGWLLGVAGAIKLTPYVFIIFLFFERDWKAMVRTASVGVASTAIVAAGWPSVAWRYWVHTAWTTKRIGVASFVSNQSWNGALHRIPMTGAEREGLWVVLVVLTLVAASGIAARSLAVGHRFSAVMALAIGGLLISPISWTHHWVWVVLIPPLIIGGVGLELSGRVRGMLLGLLLITVVAPYWWFRMGVASHFLGDLLPVWAGMTLLVWWLDGRAARAPMALRDVRHGAGER